MKSIYDVIRRPIITEKSTQLRGIEKMPAPDTWKGLGRNQVDTTCPLLDLVEIHVQPLECFT